MNEDSFHLGIKGIIRNKSGKILLLKINTERLKNFKGSAYWDIPGGRIQKGSTVLETLTREIEEETGVTNIISYKPFIMVMSNNLRIPTPTGDVGLILATYLCEIDTSKGIVLSEEHTEFGWFEPKEASELLKVKYPEELTDKIAEML